VRGACLKVSCCRQGRAWCAHHACACPGKTGRHSAACGAPRRAQAGVRVIVRCVPAWSAAVAYGCASVHGVCLCPWGPARPMPEGPATVAVDQGLTDPSPLLPCAYAQVLGEIRPYLVGTGGGELLLDSIDGPIVKVKITGPAANVMTVRVAVTQKLRERIPGIAAVQLL
jgi:hypothetical protein